MRDSDIARFPPVRLVIRAVVEEAEDDDGLIEEADEDFGEGKMREEREGESQWTDEVCRLEGSKSVNSQVVSVVVTNPDARRELASK